MILAFRDKKIGQGGFEPPTSTSRTLRATNCAIARKCLIRILFYQTEVNYTVAICLL